MSLYGIYISTFFLICHLRVVWVLVKIKSCSVQSVVQDSTSVFPEFISNVFPSHWHAWGQKIGLLFFIIVSFKKKICSHKSKDLLTCLVWRRRLYSAHRWLPMHSLLSKKIIKEKKRPPPPHTHTQNHKKTQKLKVSILFFLDAMDRDRWHSNRPSYLTPLICIFFLKQGHIWNCFSLTEMIHVCTCLIIVVVDWSWLQMVIWFYLRTNGIGDSQWRQLKLTGKTFFLDYV